jgi:hypothetical protein
MPRSKFGAPEIAQALEDFLQGTGHPLAWDDLTLGRKFDDPRLEQIRLRCASLGEEFPPSKPGEYCNEQGREIIRSYIEELRRR